VFVGFHKIVLLEVVEAYGLLELQREDKMARCQLLRRNLHQVQEMNRMQRY
jgi:hypothetical protein